MPSPECGREGILMVGNTVEIIVSVSGNSVSQLDRIALALQAVAAAATTADARLTPFGTRLSTLSGAANTMAGATRTLAAGLGTVGSQAGAAAGQLAPVVRELQGTAAAARSAAGGLSRVGGAVERATPHTKAMGTHMGGLAGHLRKVASLVEGVVIGMAAFQLIQLPFQLAGDALQAVSDWERLEKTITNMTAVEIMEASGTTEVIKVGEARVALTDKEIAQIDTLKEKREDAMARLTEMEASAGISAEKYADSERNRQLALRTTAVDMKEQELRIQQLTAKWGANGIDTQQAILKLEQLRNKYTDLQNPIDTHGLSVMKQSRAYQNLQQDIDQYNEKIGQLEGKEGAIVDVTKKVVSGQMSMTEAIAQAGPKTAETLEWLQKLAIFSPFTLDTVALTYQQGMGYGMAADQAKRMTKMLADYGAGTGRTEYQTKLLGMAIGQVFSKSKLRAEEMNQQLTESGMGVNFVAKAIGKLRGVEMSTSDLTDAMKEGTISGEEFLEAIIQLTDERYPEAAKNMATSWAGLTSTMEDIKKIGLREFFDATFKVLQPHMAKFVEVFTSEKFRGQLREWGKGLGESVGKTLQWLANDVFPAANEALKFMGEHWDTIYTTVGLVIAVFTGAALAAAVTGLVTMLAGLATPLGQLAFAVGVISTVWLEDWGGIRTKLSPVMNDIAGLLGIPQQKITDMADQNLPALADSWDAVVERMKNNPLPDITDWGGPRSVPDYGTIDWGGGRTMVPTPSQYKPGTGGGSWDDTTFPPLSGWDQGMKLLEEQNRKTVALLGESWQSLTTTIAPVWPAIGNFAQKTWDQLVKDTIQSFTTIWDSLVTIAKGIWARIEEPVLDIPRRASQVFGGLGALLMDSLDLILQGIPALVTKNFDKLGRLATEGMDRIKKDLGEALGGILLLMGDIFALAVGLVQGFVEGAWEVLKRGWEYIADQLVGHSIIPDLIDAIIETFETLPERMVGLIPRFYEAALDLGTTIKEGLIRGIRGVFGSITSLEAELRQAVKDMINSAIDAVNQAIPDDLGFSWTDPLGASHWAGVDLPDNPLPRLAGGSQMFRGGMALVGELGPELVYLPRGSQVLSASQTRQVAAGNVYNFNLTVVTPEPSRGVIQDFALMSALGGRAIGRT